MSSGTPPFVNQKTSSTFLSMINLGCFGVADIGFDVCRGWRCRNRGVGLKFSRLVVNKTSD